MEFLVNQLLGKRYILTLLTILLAGLVSWGITHTTLDNTFNGILSEDDPYREEVEQVRQDFPPSTSVLFAFLVEDDVFHFKTLQAMEDLTDRYIEVETAVSVGAPWYRQTKVRSQKKAGRNATFGKINSSRIFPNLPGLY